MEAMRIWDKVCNTDKLHTKEVKYGSRKFTAIDAQYQIMEATKLWGPYGHEWGVRDCKYGMINDSQGNPKEIYLDARFFYPHGVEPSDKEICTGTATFDISTDMAFKMDDECRKKLLTDLTTKALSKLGFNADVFMGRFDGSRPGNPLPPPPPKKPAPPKVLPPEQSEINKKNISVKMLAFKTLTGLNNYKASIRKEVGLLQKQDKEDLNVIYKMKKDNLNEESKDAK